MGKQAKRIKINASILASNLCLVVNSFSIELGSKVKGTIEVKMQGAFEDIVIL